MNIYKGLDMLTPNRRTRVEAWLNAIHNLVFITESWRSKERQQALYAQGRTKPWAIVTWTLDSAHCRWEAVDIAFNWWALYPSNLDVWREVADVAKKYWIDWWYDLWKRDMPHFQDDWTIYNITDINMDMLKEIALFILGKLYDNSNNSKVQQLAHDLAEELRK